MTTGGGYLKTPCSCGGSNENCYKCGGWGYLDAIGEGRRSPPANGFGSGPAYQGVRKRATSSPTRKSSAIRIQWCPICKDWVGDLMGHIAKQHRRAAPLVQCEHCKAMVRNIARHLMNAHHLTGSAPGSAMPLATAANPLTKKRVRCEHCKALVMVRHMPRHLRKVHHLPSPGSATPPAVVTPRQSGTQNSDIRHGINESVFDGTKDYSTSYRDHGQFGSFPCHDDYDDESSA